MRGGGRARAARSVADPVRPDPRQRCLRPSDPTSHRASIARAGRRRPVGVWINNIPTQGEMCSWFTYSTPDANKDHVVQANQLYGPDVREYQHDDQGLRVAELSTLDAGPISSGHRRSSSALLFPARFERVGQVADSGDADGDGVARVHELLRPAPHPRSAACAAAHQVTRLQCDRPSRETPEALGWNGSWCRWWCAACIRR